MPHDLKTYLRKHFPETYDAQVRWRGSRPVRIIEGAANRLKLHNLLKAQRPFYIDIRGRSGFGAVLSNAISLHYFFENYPQVKKVTCSNGLYVNDPKSDMIETYFERKVDCVETPLKRIGFRHNFDISIAPLSRGLTVSHAAELFNKHYKIRDSFIKEAENIFATKVGKAIGVHFRGSDKRFEADRADWASICRAIDYSVENTGIQNIFVATDEAEFVSYMIGKYGANRVCFLDNQQFSTGGMGVHFLPGDRLEKGRQALLTTMLLSMCHVCIRGASHLSAWAKILNPQLPIIMIGQPYSFEFPEDAIIETAERLPLL